MRDLLDEIDRWRREGRRAALARVVGVEGSGPRDPGAAMAVNEDGDVVGSVSGGCVEAAVVEVAQEVLAGRRGPHCVSFGYSDDEAFAVGLTCGGTLHLFVEPFDWSAGGASGVAALYERLRDAIRAGEPVALATQIQGPQPGAKLLVFPQEQSLGDLGDPELTRVVARDARGELESGRTGTRHYGLRGEARQSEVAVFIESFAPPPRMIVFGAVDFTAALVQAARGLGYRVTVCDAREVFATRRRFPSADHVVNLWPQELLAEIGPSLGPRDAICVLTHDHKFDVPALTAALATGVGYIGCMGSRRTHEQRVARLREAGVEEAALARVMAPIGLDIGARTPEETAVSICAEIIALRAGRPAPSLREGTGPIHARVS